MKIMGSDIDADLRTAESIGMLPISQRTPPIVKSLLSQDFVAAYPTLVHMLSSASLDQSILSLVIDRFRQVRSGNENVHEASVDVGQALATHYFPRR